MHCCVVDVFSSMLSSLSLFLSYKLVGKEYRVLLHFFLVLFLPSFSYYVKALRVIHFPTLPVVVGNRVATQDYVSWCAAEDETRETEHWTAIKEPPTLARTLRHLRYL